MLVYKFLAEERVGEEARLLDEFFDVLRNAVRVHIVVVGVARHEVEEAVGIQLELARQTQLARVVDGHQFGLALHVELDPAVVQHRVVFEFTQSLEEKWAF
jgi:hypothetical protein